MKSIMKMWRSFWGSRYRIYKDDKEVGEVLIYELCNSFHNSYYDKLNIMAS